MKRAGDREVSFPIEKGSPMDLFYQKEAEEQRMSLRGWIRFLLQERFKLQTGQIAFSPYWNGPQLIGSEAPTRPMVKVPGKKESIVIQSDIEDVMSSLGGMDED